MADSRMAQFASSDPRGADFPFWDQKVYFDGVPRRRREIVTALAHTPGMNEATARYILLGAKIADGTPLACPPVAWFADPKGSKGDLDEGGRWITESGQHIHITSDGQIDAGGHPALRAALEKAGLKSKGGPAAPAPQGGGDKSPAIDREKTHAELKTALGNLLKAAGSEKKAVSISTAMKSKKVPEGLKDAYRTALAAHEGHETEAEGNARYENGKALHAKLLEKGSLDVEMPDGRKANVKKSEGIPEYSIKTPGSKRVYKMMDQDAAHGWLGSFKEAGGGGQAWDHRPDGKAPPGMENLPPTVTPSKAGMVVIENGVPVDAVTKQRVVTGDEKPAEPAKPAEAPVAGKKAAKKALHEQTYDEYIHSPAGQRAANRFIKKMTGKKGYDDARDPADIHHDAVGRAIADGKDVSAAVRGEHAADEAKKSGVSPVEAAEKGRAVARESAQSEDERVKKEVDEDAEWLKSKGISANRADLERAVYRKGDLPKVNSGHLVRDLKKANDQTARYDFLAGPAKSGWTGTQHYIAKLPEKGKERDALLKASQAHVDSGAPNAHRAVPYEETLKRDVDRASSAEAGIVGHRNLDPKGDPTMAHTKLTDSEGSEIRVPSHQLAKVKKLWPEATMHISTKKQFGTPYKSLVFKHKGQPVGLLMGLQDS